MRVQVVKNIEKDFLEPSFKLFVQNGLENTSVRDLCKVIEISTGSLYYWFEDKDDLYVNVARYGVGKVVCELQEAIFEKIDDPELLFDTLLETADRFKPELRFIIQMTSSPVYGQRMQEELARFRRLYEDCAERLAELFDCTAEEMLPNVSMLGSVLMDYVVWEHYDSAKTKIDFLYQTMLRAFSKV